MNGRITGIGRSSLWRAWKAIRKELRNGTNRDVTDFLEYDVDPNIWIDRLLGQIARGSYEPHTPWRFTVAKSNGFSRRMTMPSIPDLVLYRAIGFYLQNKLRHKEHDHVYFERGELAKATQAAKAEADLDKGGHQDGWNSVAEIVMDYESHSKRRKRAWLHYSQYRKLLIFKRIYPFIVATDITNIFDTILHDKLAECFHSITAPPRMIGLLFFLLERLSIREAFSESPRVGLPVDEFDCSRQLAHIFLYSHDTRVVEKVGSGAYVRWMDDQNIGVDSRADGLHVLARIGDSLSQLHLTANAGKSRILSLGAARRHFHLDLNDDLDNIEPFVRQKHQGTHIGRLVRAAWIKAKSYEHEGEWEKILKRFYRYAALGNVRYFRRRAIPDILAYPRLADRIADYVRTTSTGSEYLNFATKIWSHPEQVYPDVNATIVERLLLLEPRNDEQRKILGLAGQILDGKWQFAGAAFCYSVAPLLILRYGSRATAKRLHTFVMRHLDHNLPVAVRACAITYASYGILEYDQIRKLAAKMFRNPLADTVRLIDQIRTFKEMPSSFKQRIRTEFDSVSGRPFLDMRMLLTARLLNLNTHSNVIKWQTEKNETLANLAISKFDRAILRRLFRNRSPRTTADRRH